MKSILVLGAGRSSSSLISYLLTEAEKHSWSITVGDFSEAMAKERIGKSAVGKAISFDITDTEKSEVAIEAADIVISLIPAHLHPLVAKLCLQKKKHLLTASYVSDEMQSFHEEAKEKNLLFMNECGLDPGIDHMSAMQVMDKIKSKGGKITSFESFTGGLIAPETDPGNPWRYKFTWNSRNVVMAGQSTAKYLQHGSYRFVPYQQLFQRIVPVSVPGYGEYEGYANRDSLKYIGTYGLDGIQTMLRGTLRNKGFCSAWNVFVQLGCCDDTYEMENVNKMTHRDFIDAFLSAHFSKTIQQKISEQLGVSIAGHEMECLQWSGLFENEKIGLLKGTPAQILEHILNKKWKLNASDKDLIVMWHRFVYEQEGKKKEIQASLIAKGDDSTFTAMAKTVGLPLAIAAKLLMQNKIQQRGVAIPVSKEIYEPVLEELKSMGIELVEREVEL
ncbi:MAG TPA: saccharopine dehydrogenase C-terminal domain-containing protein [Cyclobacteriaceae bacterium]